MKKVFILILVLVSLTTFAAADFHVYPLTGKIVDFNYEEDLVLFVDGGGMLWEFYGIEDYQIGDFVSCIVWDVGTQKIFDDEILDVVYAGVF